MSISITIPGSVAKVAAGAICVKGDLDAGALEVRSKIYAGGTTPPGTPPTDAIVGTVSEGTFAFTSVTGAQSSASTPYPNNTVAVWAKYAGSPPTWQMASTDFGGKSDTQTDCA